MMAIHYFFLFFVALLIVSPASAGSIETINDAVKAVNETIEIINFVVDLLSQKNWDRDWKVASDEGKPVKNWKHTDRISAWINITGFEKESVINRTRYINGSGKDHAIVKRYAEYKLNSGEKIKDFNTTLIITDGINTTTAVQKSTLKYKKFICDSEDVCKWITQSPEKLTISVTVKSPENFTTRIPTINTTITRFNRSFGEVTYIDVPTENDPSMKDVMVVIVEYNGSKLLRYDQIGWVCNNDRGCEYVEFVDDGLPLWTKDDDQTTIYHCGKSVVVSTENFNISKLNISIHTPYESVNLSNITVIDVSDATVISVPVLRIILIIAVMILSIIGILKVFICVM